MRNLLGYFKSIGFLFVLSMLLTSWGGKSQKMVVVKNPSDFDRFELISIPYNDFINLIDAKAPFKIVNKENNIEYLYQLETLGKKKPINILIQVLVPASQEIHLIVKKGKPSPINSKTFARYVPERFDDFAWENDVIAYRMYGKALEGRSDDAQGMDIWVKKTENLVIDKWYKTEDYHKDHGEGLDYYSVGQTLGAGDVAAYSEGTLYYSKHYRNYAILDNGPLRTTFRLEFEQWKVKDTAIKLNKTVSIDAGAQLNRVVLDFDFDGDDKLTIAAGIAKRKQPGQVFDNHRQGVFAYWEPEHGDDGITGVGLIFNNPIDSIKIEKDQYLALFQAKSDDPVEYFTGGVWNKAGKIKSADDWFRYLQRQKLILKNPLEIKIY